MNPRDVVEIWTRGLVTAGGGGSIRVGGARSEIYAGDIPRVPLEHDTVISSSTGGLALRPFLVVGF